MLNYVSAHKECFENVTLDQSSFAVIEEQHFEGLFKTLCEDEKVARALSPMLLFGTLPASYRWARLLPLPDESDGSFVVDAVSRVYNHQSTMATDCRWVRIMTENAKGHFLFTEAMKEAFQRVINYPDEADSKSAGSSVRALEMTTRPMVSGQSTSPWTETFWAECWSKSECILANDAEAPIISHKDMLEQVHGTYAAASRALSHER
jgi:hypothetical protein